MQNLFNFNVQTILTFLAGLVIAGAVLRLKQSKKNIADTPVTHMSAVAAGPQIQPATKSSIATTRRVTPKSGARGTIQLVKPKDLALGDLILISDALQDIENQIQTNKSGVIDLNNLIDINKKYPGILGSIVLDLQSKDTDMKLAIVSSLKSSINLDITQKLSFDPNTKPSNRVLSTHKSADRSKPKQRPSLDDLQLHLSNNPSWVLKNLLEYYPVDRDLTADRETLGVIIESLRDDSAIASQIPETQLLKSIRSQARGIFNQVLRHTEGLQAGHALLGPRSDKNGVSLSASFDEIVSDVHMLTGLDFNENDDGADLYPCERVCFLIKHGYSGDHGDMSMLVDPSPALVSGSGAEGGRLQRINLAVDGINDLQDKLKRNGFAKFILMISEEHFVAGAIVKSQGKCHLITVDSSNHNPPQNGMTASNIVRLMLNRYGNNPPRIDQVHDSYDCLRDKGHAVDLQRDGRSCGPFSCEVMSKLDKKHCLAIAENRLTINNLVSEIAQGEDNNWSVERSRVTGESARKNQYQFLDKFLHEKLNQMNERINNVFDGPNHSQGMR